MRLAKTIAILLALAFVIVVAVKLLGVRGKQETDQRETAQAARIREFWNAYREASQKRAAGEIEAAIVLYQDAIRSRPEHEDSLYYLGNCYFELGRYLEAIATYERLVAANPLGSSRGYVQLALVYACLEANAPVDFEKAKQFFQRAMEVDPDSGALLGIGEVAMLEGKWHEAWDALANYNTDNPMSMAAAYLLGYLRWRKGDRQQAWQWFRQAVQRGELKKPNVKWTEEGDVKADPELRWRALARQSVMGKHWLRLRAYLKTPDFALSSMDAEYELLSKALKSS